MRLSLKRFTEQGGKDYTELVFRLKVGGMDKGIPVEAIQERPMFDAAGKVVMEKSLPSRASVPFKQPGHFNVKNEIAHVRFKTRMKGNMKVLNVEEMQSDFAIASRQKLKDYKKITDFPFKNNWYELTLKRLIRYASDNGFDAVAVPKGSVAAKRYGQNIDKLKVLKIQKNRLPTHHQVSGQKLKYEGNSKNEYVVRYFDEDGKDFMEKVFFDNNLKNLEKEIGSKNFNKLVDLEKTKKLQTGTGEVKLALDKSIILGSGKGKFELYDKAIPSFMKKFQEMECSSI